MKLAAFNRLQDDSILPTSEEQLLYQNMCILGLAGVGSKHAFGPDLTRSSFRKCNTKALEYCLYHLHGVLRGRSRSQKEFKGIWPLIDKPQQVAFYQKMIEWLKELKDAGKIENASSMQMSVLRTASGHRIVALLLDLSAAAMHAELERLRPLGSDSWSTQSAQPQESKLTEEIGSAILVIAQAKVKLLCTKFLQANHDAATVQAQQEAFSKELVSDYQLLRSQDQRIRHELGDDTSLLDQLAKAPWRTPDKESFLPSSSSKAPAGQHPHTTDSNRAGQADMAECPVLLPPFLALPLLLQPDSVDDSLRLLCGATAATAPHNHTHPSSAIQSLPLLVDQMAQLQEHLQDHKSLHCLLDSSTSTAAHPHAIDGVRLAAAAASAARLEIAVGDSRVTMLHSGSTGSSSSVWPSQFQQRDPLGRTGPEVSVPVHPAAILSGFAAMVGQVAAGITKLNSTSATQQDQYPGSAALIASPHISSSHAAHLAVRVRMHTASVGRLLELRTELKTRLGTAEKVLGGWSTAVHNKMAQVNHRYEAQEADPAPDAALLHHPPTPLTESANPQARQLATPQYMGMGGRSVFTSMQASLSPPLQQQQSPPSNPSVAIAQGYSSSSRSNSTPVPPQHAYPMSSSSEGYPTQSEECVAPEYDPAVSSEPAVNPYQQHQHSQQQQSTLQGFAGISPWAPKLHPAVFVDNLPFEGQLQDQPCTDFQSDAIHQSAQTHASQAHQPPGLRPNSMVQSYTQPCDSMDVDSDSDLDLIAQEVLDINWQEVGTAQGCAEPSATRATAFSINAAVPCVDTALLQQSPIPTNLPAFRHHMDQAMDMKTYSTTAAPSTSTGSGPRRLDFGGAIECTTAAGTPQEACMPDGGEDASLYDTRCCQDVGSTQSSALSPPTSLVTPAAVTMSTLLQRYNRVSKY